jgi:hypothetical protein
LNAERQSFENTSKVRIFKKLSVSIAGAMDTRDFHDNRRNDVMLDARSLGGLMFRLRFLGIFRYAQIRETSTTIAAMT